VRDTASVNVLEKELKAYEEMKEELLKKYRGKVVVIKDGKLLGVYKSEEDAFKDVLEKYGLVPVLIKRVVDKEKPEEIPSYTYGLLGVVVTE
jgi:hypothetical protein